MRVSDAVRFQRMGIPASVAEVFGTVVDATTLTWLSQTFSQTGMRALAARHELRPLGALDWLALHGAAEENLASSRAYVSKTQLSVADLSRMVTFGVRYSSFAAWLEPLEVPSAGASLTQALNEAVVVHGVPQGHLDGWVRFAARFGVPLSARAAGWSFLGGDTALLAAAGLSPTEAVRMREDGSVDVSTLTFLAGLRGHRTMALGGGGSR